MPQLYMHKSLQAIDKISWLGPVGVDLMDLCLMVALSGQVCSGAEKW
jgi:hypothetical protein